MMLKTWSSALEMYDASVLTNSAPQGNLVFHSRRTDTSGCFRNEQNAVTASVNKNFPVPQENGEKKAIIHLIKTNSAFKNELQAFQFGRI